MSHAVHVETTVSDYTVAQKVICRGAGRGLYLWLIPPVAIAIIAWFGLTVLLSAVTNLGTMITMAISFPAYLFIYFRAARYFNRFRYKYALDPSGPFLSPTELKLLPEGIFWSNHRGEGRTAWHAVPRVEETKTHVYLFIDRAMAHVVPKRCFASEATAAEFVSTAQRYVDAARAAKA